MICYITCYLTCYITVLYNTLYNMLFNMLNRLLSGWTVFCTIQKLIICDLCLCSSSCAPAPSPRSTATARGPSGSQGLGRLWNGPRWAWLPHSSDEIDLALAALMEYLLEITADELETLLNDLPMPEPGAKDGISVKEALEVSTHAI